MALTIVDTNTITRAIQLSKRFIDEMMPILQGLNLVADPPTTGMLDRVTQEDLDAIPALSGLTVAELENAFNVLTFTLRLENPEYTNLLTLAVRG